MLLIYWYNMNILLNNLSSSNIYFIDIPTESHKAGTIYSSQPHIFCTLSFTHTSEQLLQNQSNTQYWHENFTAYRNHMFIAAFQVLSSIMPSTPLVQSSATNTFVMTTKTHKRRKKRVQLQMSTKTHTTTITMRFQFDYKCSQRVRNAVSLLQQTLCFRASVPQTHLEGYLLTPRLGYEVS